MKISKLLLGVFMLVSLVFSTITLLVIPLWSDIQVFLGTTFPVMLIAFGFGAFCLSVVIYRWFKPEVKRAWPHYLMLSLAGLFMLTLLYVLLTELGTERVLIWRNAKNYLPAAGFFAAAAYFFIFPPKKTSIRAALVAGFLVVGLIWVNLPLSVQIQNEPIALVHAEGVSVVWGTNMAAVNRLDYGQNESFGSTAGSQTGGLRILSENLQNVSIAWDLSSDLYLQATSEGVRSVFPTSAFKAGITQSDVVLIPFPAEGEPVSFIAFSDLHEQTELTAELSGNLAWEGVDYAIYVGDLLNNTGVPEQVIDSILNLPTGENNLPRIFVRGNHETRGPAARQLANWLLPPGGEWYYTFSSGDVLFIILDSGEDKADDHSEYAGLVDFNAYHLQQAEWLAGVFNSQEYQQAATRIVLVHQPPFADIPEAFSPVAELLETQTEIDLVISGHIHEAGIWLPDDTGLPFPVVTCGGSSRDDMAAVKVEIGLDGLHLSIFDLTGDVLEEATLSQD